MTQITKEAIEAASEITELLRDYDNGSTAMKLTKLTVALQLSWPKIRAALPFLPIAEEGKAPDWWQDEEAAEREFTEYFVRNYPEPVLDDPAAHAAKLFRAAKRSLLATNVLISSPGKDGG